MISSIAFSKSFLKVSIDLNNSGFSFFIASLFSVSLTHHVIIDEKEVEEAIPMDREDALFTVTTLTTIINLLSRKFRKQIVS